MFGVELPYGTAFKLVTVAGLLTLPAAAYAFGRLADLAFPGPALLAVATVPFLFDRNFTIYGGNVASTLAGEFAFSISLSLCVLYLGVVIRGLRTGRHRALAAVLLALTGLCHIIPVFYALAGTAIIVLVTEAGPAASIGWDVVRGIWQRPLLGTSDGALPAVVRVLLRPVEVLARLVGRVVSAPVRFVWRVAPAVRGAVVWLIWVFPVAGLLASFWVLPFFWQRAYVNDMGWEKLPYANETIWKYLIPRRPDLAQDIRWVLALAIIGLVLSVAFRVQAGWILAGFVILAGVAFVFTPQGRLWNARLLPFYYLALYLLAAVGVSESGRTLAVLAARDPDRPNIIWSAVTAGGALLASLVLVGLPLRTLPFGTTRADDSYSFLGLVNGPGDRELRALLGPVELHGLRRQGRLRGVPRPRRDHGPAWARSTAADARSGSTRRSSTATAPRWRSCCFPHWTDGCIGSMEGLFFEASATTPFHFLTQVELSAAPSAAQRDLPYNGFDFDKGIEHLQLMGVRYYLSTSVQATTAAKDHPDLTELATSGPWTIFQVADTDLVEPLANEPAVLDDVQDAQHDWICRTKDDAGRCAGPAITWFTDPSRWDVFLASSGPDELAARRHRRPGS